MADTTKALITETRSHGKDQSYQAWLVCRHCDEPVTIRPAHLKGSIRELLPYACPHCGKSPLGAESVRIVVALSRYDATTGYQPVYDEEAEA